MKAPENLIDVLSEESFARERIPGACNFCVYEMAFVEKVSSAFPDRSVELTVYGWSGQTREADEAAARLRAAGYQSVEILEGGLEAWKARGGRIEGTAQDELQTQGHYTLDTAESFIHWTGRNLFNFHTGELSFQGGELELTDGLLTGGRLTIAMETMRCTDIADATMNGLLIEHLRSSDFFSVDTFPMAELAVVGSALLKDATPGRPNLHVDAELTLRGETHGVGFDVVAARRDDGALVAQGTLGFDRTLWGSIYGSGRFFARLGRHVVNDLIDLRVKVVAVPDTGR